MAESYISELGDSLSHGVANTNGDRVKIIAPKLYNDGNGNHPSIATALAGKSSTSHTHTTTIASDSSSGTVVTLAHNTQYKLTAGGTSVLFKTPADSNTDTKVTQTLTTTADAAYPILTKNTTETSNVTDTSRFTTGVTLNPKNKSITATTFIGALSGNATTATKATQDSDGNAINATYFKSLGNVTLASGTATKIGTQNGTYVELTLPTIPAAANNGALQLQLNGGTATSKFTANQSGNSTLAFSTGSTAGTFKVDSTEIAIAGFTKVETSSTNGNIKINGTETTVYTHPTTAGNKHIPSGGSSGQFLGWDSAGTAKWVNPNSDTRVTQTKDDSGATAYPLLMAGATDPNGSATTARYDSGVKLTPSTNTISANISGTADTAKNYDSSGGTIQSAFSSVNSSLQSLSGRVSSVENALGGYKIVVGSLGQDMDSIYFVRT